MARIVKEELLIAPTLRELDSMVIEFKEQKRQQGKDVFATDPKNWYWHPIESLDESGPVIGAQEEKIADGPELPKGYVPRFYTTVYWKEYVNDGQSSPKQPTPTGNPQKNLSEGDRIGRAGVGKGKHKDTVWVRSNNEFWSPSPKLSDFIKEAGAWFLERDEKTYKFIPDMTDPAEPRFDVYEEEENAK